ncbi:BTAD domain-containing putative transcriptional regulator [Kitasatospora sp. NPDC048286]|uniref:AfsR/SARP family transcriptional regulator n=1 Tax=Kitasatospora sp. NPDC048286 TaxID=3364047 RepID=UPI00371117D2
MQIQLLGPTRAWRDDREIVLGPPKQRAVFALLASRANDVVGVEQIIDAVWGSDIPQTAANGVHTYVGGLRRSLEPSRSRRENSEVLVSSGGGYLLRIDPTGIDTVRFADRHTQARRLRARGDVEGSLEAAESALSLWRAEAFSGIPGPFAALERTRLQDQRLTVVEEWAAGMLEVGRAAEVVTVLSAAVAEEALREQLRWLLMLALYRCGRQAHALELYRETRHLLREELGIEPGAELQLLHQQILAGQPCSLPWEQQSVSAATATTVESFAPGLPMPAQLPPLARGFVGRVAESAHVARLISEETEQSAATPVVVVDGPAGVGKTAFALEAAHQLSDRFPDGQLYVDLSGHGPGGKALSASDALLQLLRGLGVDDARMPADLAGRSALYRSLLHSRRMLVMLDGALSAEQVRPLIPRGFSCVVATSRQKLSGLAVRDGAHLVRLGPLGAQESLDLLGGLTEGRLDGQDASARRLVRLCGGMPLALRIAAEALVADPEESPADLVEQFAVEQGRLDRLMVQGDEAASLRAAFESSYQALSTEAARLFRLLGLHPGGPITVPAVAALAGISRREARDTLELLSDNHLLVEVRQHEYRFHDLIALYAVECAQREPRLQREAAMERLMLWRKAVPADSAA